MTDTNEPAASHHSSAHSNPLHLSGFDYIELYVGNAQQAAHFYRTAFGFSPVACAGLETGMQDRLSILLEQGSIRLVLTSPLEPFGEIAEHVRMHGDGVKDIAFAVKDAEHAFKESVRLGARPLMEPKLYSDEGGEVVKATIGAYGDTVHSFIQRDKNHDPFFPGYRRLKDAAPAASGRLTEIDHIAVGVEAGELDRWIEFYNNVLGLHQTQYENIATEHSAMNSKVVADTTGNIKFPIIEPAEAKRHSQVDEHLKFYHGAGVQHLALQCRDIIGTVAELSHNGIEFLQTPSSYYESLPERVGEISEDLEQLRQHNILVDRDESGYLMQIFTKPLQGRPTLFMEIIERKGAKGFGSGNIRALFESVEREQASRGSL